MKKQVHAYISGRVQGVFFRASAAHVARLWRLGGFARNLPDGRVEVVVEGEEEQVNEMIAWCHAGPAGAHVEDVDVVWSEATGGYTDFKIR